jgi:ParB-like chromosome segregation protein Spo0J
MTNYEFHPFADVWRLFTEDEFAKLKADIQAHGMRLPIILYAGKILDGRNRYRACRELGIPTRYETAKAKTDAEALALVVSLNEHRRHLSEAERAFIAEKLATMTEGRQKTVTASKEGVTVLSVPDAAKLMNVSKQAVERARAVKQHHPELEAEVKAGRKTLSAAADEARRKAAAKRQPKEKAADGLTPWKRALAMREERARNHKHLTREEVDPNFTGTGMEFVEKYGHVQMETAAERAARDERIADLRFSGAVAKMAEAAEIMLSVGRISRSRLTRRMSSKQRVKFRARMKAIAEAMRILEEFDLDQDDDAADAPPILQ